MKFMILFLCLFSVSPMLAGAQSLPKSAGSDSRVQVFDYNPNEVYVIYSKAGYASLIQLEEDEQIDDDGALGMGLADSWNVAVKGNNIFFKPVSQMPDTNLLLVTNKHTYAFVLSTQTDTKQLTYIARFHYPVKPKPMHPSTVPSILRFSHTDASGTNIYIDGKYNTNYASRGHQMIAPTNAWDDGVFTYLKYAHANDLPTAYRVLPDGSEMLVNSHVQNDTLVIHEIGKNYRLRLGNAVLDIANKTVRLPAFNTTGTGDKDWIRLDK